MSDERGGGSGIEFDGTPRSRPVDVGGTPTLTKDE